MSNKAYETAEDKKESKTLLPGGKNVRLSYSRGVTLSGAKQFEFDRFDIGYEGDFEAEEADEKFALMKAYIDKVLARSILKTAKP
jgi:hypothetical protein